MASSSQQRHQCISIKSRRHINLRCPNPAVLEGQWCAVHGRSRIPWVPHQSPQLIPLSESNVLEVPSLTLEKKKARQRRKVVNPKQNVNIVAAKKIQNAWLLHGRLRLIKECGLLLFCPEEAHNEKDIYTYDNVNTIPFSYRFSYKDDEGHAWLFDLRFVLHLLQYGSDLKNPFTQAPIPPFILERLQLRSNSLQKMKKPIVYIDETELTAEQIWNQKVLDIFLKLNALGYCANILWFESLGVRGQEYFYTKLYDIWMNQMQLTDEARESIIPGYNSGRAALFRWHPNKICGRGLELKWWRKQNLNLMKTFITRSHEKDMQVTGALYILTAMANVHPRAAESFPWLVQEA